MINAIARGKVNDNVDIEVGNPLESCLSNKGGWSMRNLINDCMDTEVNFWKNSAVADSVQCLNKM